MNIEKGLPKTMNDAVTELISKLSEEVKNKIRKTPKKDLGGEFHFGLGTWIRNNFGLWAGNDELMQSVCGDKYGDPDHASSVIIEEVWKVLRKEAKKQAYHVHQ